MSANIRLLLRNLLSIATSQYQLTHYQVVLIVCMIFGLIPMVHFLEAIQFSQWCPKKETHII